MKKVTIEEIAQKAGCSEAAVELAFSEPGSVDKALCGRITAAAEEAGFAGELAAQVLAARKTNTIGFLLPQPIEDVFDNQYFSELVRGIGSVCHREGLTLSILSPLKGIISQTIQTARVDGIIVLGVSNASPVHELLRRRKMPYVTMDADGSGEYINVGIDDEGAAERMLDLLLELGHRRICFCTLQPISTDISDPQFSLTSDYRNNGILKSIKKHKLEAAAKKDFVFYEAPSRIEEAIVKAEEVLSAEKRPTAVCCMGDSQALPFYYAAAKLGLHIPADLSVSGFDDLPSSALLYPPLTTVHQPGYEKGRIAAELLLAKLGGRRCESVVMDSPIVERGSTARAG